jgi:hypothetical protein
MGYALIIRYSSFLNTQKHWYCRGSKLILLSFLAVLAKYQDFRQLEIYQGVRGIASARDRP